MLRPAALAALAALTALAATPAQAQTPAPAPAPDTIVVRTPDNEARKRFNEGNDLLRQENYEGALALFDEGLRLDPASNKNAYGRALALAQLDREDDAVAAFQQAITLSETAADGEVMDAARRALGLISYNRAMALLQANPLPQPTAEQALPLLTEAEAGQVDANQLAYQLARVHNVLGNHADAERYAERALEVNADLEDKSAYYIELGIARQNAGDAEGAREAFEQARTGAWSGWAEHYLRQLDEGAGAGGESSASEG